MIYLSGYESFSVEGEPRDYCVTNPAVVRATDVNSWPLDYKFSTSAPNNLATLPHLQLYLLNSIFQSFFPSSVI